MSTTDTGRAAEELVAGLLRLKKHKIISMNWRTRWCEIDTVSQVKKTVYFTEVKYRSSGAWGDGFSYITKKKIKQMRFAADFWLASNSWNGDCVLQAAEVDEVGNINIIEIID